jgi:hypothetical protein
MVFLAIGIWPALANADVIFNLTPPALTAFHGSTVQFAGSLINTGTTDVFLNGTVANLPYAHLTLDDSPFFLFSPLFLPGGGRYTGRFFDVTVDATADAGTYFGSFTILGGANSDSFDSLAQQDFSVTVATPEPGSLVLVGTAVVFIFWRRLSAAS